MRFMFLGGGGATVIRHTFALDVRVTAGTIGVAGTRWASICHSSMITAGDGTVLIANGFQPMQRLRQGEKQFTSAGVQGPSQQPYIMTAAEIAADSDAIIPQDENREYHFDFTEYGEVVGKRNLAAVLSSGDPALYIEYTPGGKAALEARMRAYNNLMLEIGDNDSIIVDYIAPLETPKAAIRTLFDGRSSFGNTDVIKWNYMVFTVTLLNKASSGNPNFTTFNGTYQTFMRYVDKDGKVSNPSPISNPTLLSGAPYVYYTNLEVPVDTRVVRRQIFRNESGNVNRFYLDIDTDDVSSTSMASYLTDVQLTNRYGLYAFDENGDSMFYRYYVPPVDKPYVCEYKERVFAAGYRTYSEGCLEVVSGSNQVTGIGTEFFAGFIGWKIFIGIDEYTVANVDEDTQVITLDRDHAGLSDKFATYVITPYFANKNLLYYTMPGQPEAWEFLSAILLPEDNDVVTGLIVFSGAMWVLKNRSIKSFVYTVDPARDGDYKPVSSRGCVSQRCAIMVQNAALMLDRMGIWRFEGNVPRYTNSGSTAPDHLSLPIGDVFRLDGTNIKLNWKADKCWWSAAECQELHIARWYVALQGYRKPRHAICWDYLNNKWHIESYPIPITASCTLVNSPGRPALGGQDGKMYFPDTGPLDFVDSDDTYFGIDEVLSGYRLVLDSTPDYDLTGMTVGVVQGRGLEQYRRIVRHEDDVIEVDMAFNIWPDEDSKLQIGAIPYKIVTPIYDFARYGFSNVKVGRLRFKQREAHVHANIKVYEDGAAREAAAKQTWGWVESSNELNKDSYTIDMSLAAVADVTMSKFRDTTTQEPNEVQLCISGFSGNERPLITAIALVGAANNPETAE